MDVGMAAHLAKRFSAMAFQSVIQRCTDPTGAVPELNPV